MLTSLNPSHPSSPPPNGACSSELPGHGSTHASPLSDAGGGGGTGWPRTQLPSDCYWQEPKAEPHTDAGRGTPLLNTHVSPMLTLSPP